MITGTNFANYYFRFHAGAIILGPDSSYFASARQADSQKVACHFGLPADPSQLRRRELVESPDRHAILEQLAAHAPALTSVEYI